MSTTNAGSELVRFTRWGIGGDYTGAHVTFSLAGRDYVTEVVSMRHREMPSCWLFKVRHFDGSDVDALPNSEIAAAAVRVLTRSHETGCVPCGTAEVNS